LLPLPSFVLSGFMFPFKGMPVWAHWAGELFPTRHALRIVRGVLLKGNGLVEIAPELWRSGPLRWWVAVIAPRCYRVTLD
jgi:ABC-2 type transport system permease protein